MENREIDERYGLVIERIFELRSNTEVLEKYQDYFKQAAEFICLTDCVLRQKEMGTFDNRTLEECDKMNHKLYADLLPENYESSYLNPQTAVRTLGEEFGRLLCFLYTELHALTAYAFEGRKECMVLFCELFMEIYCVFAAEKTPEQEEIQHILYWFFYDYNEVFAQDKVRGLVEWKDNYFVRIIQESDLKDIRYLYRYGEYISDCEIKMANFLNTLSETEIQSMADTLTEGFRIGYENLGKDLGQKDTVCVEYPIGFERIVRAVISNLKEMGLMATVYRLPISSFFMGSGRARGCYTKSINKQFEFDHKSDSACYMDKAYAMRQIETMRAAFETYKKQARHYAGPAVIETFGEEPFRPLMKPEAYRYSEKQNELKVYLTNCLGQMTNEYIPGDERSFTIIAYPIPAIGKNFEAVFRETVKINTLDYMQYQFMQQKIIDVLDLAKKVHITGKGDNQTDLWVNIYPLSNPEKETAFENCVADVNIPVGEVFTTPVLEGTNGKLHVTKVYLNELEYLNLELDFTDGFVTKYTCTNFKSKEENHKFLYDNLMQQHRTLPMGEFAIGTNTTAYRMAKEYNIADKLPILIAEKMGPHFAIGDTCYSHAEDTKVYNPDGKEIVARDNSVSVLRKEDLSKAYFNCHTDITIPYEELGSITVVTAEGKHIDIIRDGKFAVDKTEALNEPLK